MNFIRILTWASSNVGHEKGRGKSMVDVGEFRRMKDRICISVGIKHFARYEIVKYNIVQKFEEKFKKHPIYKLSGC